MVVKCLAYNKILVIVKHTGYQLRVICESTNPHSIDIYLSKRYFGQKYLVFSAIVCFTPYGTTLATFPVIFETFLTQGTESNGH